MRDPTLEEIAAVLDGAKVRHGELRACCPAHGGDNPEALSMTYKDGKLLATCHTKHCTFAEIMAAIRVRLGEPQGETVKIRAGNSKAESTANSKPEVHTWELKDAGGNLIALHVREDTPDGKSVRWKQPSGTWGLGGQSTNDLPLYGAEIVARAPVNVPVVLTEGEKAADALRRAGIMGVGTVTGAAGTPSAESLEILRGRKVILWPDNDKGGFEHMGRVAEGLVDVASELLWYEWPDAPEKGDAADHPGPDITELMAAPRWSRAPAIEGRVLLGRAILNGIDPPTELLPDILLAGKAHNIFAPGGVGKTWVLVWIATELVKRGKRVVVFDLENGFRTYAERFEEMGGEPEELDRLLHYYPFPVFDAESYARMLDEDKPDLVMFDSWIGFLAAEGRDENEAADISAWAEAYSKPALRRGTAVVVLDHVPHEHDDRERGSRRKRDEVDVAWRLTKIGDFDRERVGLLAMTRVKDREGWLPERLTFEIGGDVGTGRFVMQRNDDLAPVKIIHLDAKQRAALAVLESFGARGASTSEWLDALHEQDELVSKATLHRVRRVLFEKGEILEDGSRYVAKSTQHVGGVSGMSDTLMTEFDTGTPGGVSGVSPLIGVNTRHDTPPSRPGPVDVGGFGATKEERERKYEEMKRKLRARREERERED